LPHIVGRKLPLYTA